MKLFGLKHKKDGILGISISSNGDDAEFCNDTSCHLKKWYAGDAIYLTPNETDLAAVMEGVGWYNSTPSRPVLPSYYKRKDLSVYSVDIPE